MAELPISESGIANRRLRRRSLSAAYVNAGLWGVGSGLASVTLVIFLARKVHADGLAISWILAAPSLAGLVRLATPAWLDRVASRRRFCIVMFLASAAVLAALPLVATPGMLSNTRGAVFAVGAAWAGYQTLEAVGAVALWSWLGDLVPGRVRGRFIGRREAWLNGGAVVGACAAIAVTLLWPRYAPTVEGVDREWQAYAACALAGAALFVAAAIVLVRMSDAPRAPSVSNARHRFHLRDLLVPLVDRNFHRFMAFGLWFSISNGLIQTAQSIFLIGPLGLTFATKKTLDGVSRGVKASLLPWIGSRVDRRGNMPVLAASQALIALAPLFLLYATPISPWWVLGTYACWLAYGGHDVALPNLMLGLSKPGDTATYAAAWFAWTQLAFSLSTLAGGALFDAMSKNFEPLSLGGRPLDYYFVLFAASGALKSLGVPLALRIPEPTPNE